MDHPLLYGQVPVAGTSLSQGTAGTEGTSARLAGRAAGGARVDKGTGYLLVSGEDKGK